MSLLPILLVDYSDEMERPRRLLDRRYGLALRPEDLFESYSSGNSGDIIVYRPFRKINRRYQPYEMQEPKYRGVSVIKSDKEKLQVIIDVQHFLPEEISVKVVGNNVLIEAKHEEKEDDHGWISRHFLRKYAVPILYDIDQVTSRISSDGQLTITAPRKMALAIESSERVIDIQKPGKSAVQESKASGEAMGSKRTERAVEKKEDQPNSEKKKKNAAT